MNFKHSITVSKTEQQKKNTAAWSVSFLIILIT